MINLPNETENKHGPRCPNHQVVLILTDTKGIGICPISKCEFAYEAEEEEDTGSQKEEIKVDSAGNTYVAKKYKIKKKDENDPRE